jgi:hypothetical protein
MNDLLPPARRSIPEQRRKRMRDKLDAEIDAASTTNRRDSAARRFGVPAVAAVAVAAIAIGGYLLASNSGDDGDGGVGPAGRSGLGKDRQDGPRPKQGDQNERPEATEGRASTVLADPERAYDKCVDLVQRQYGLRGEPVSEQPTGRLAIDNGIGTTVVVANSTDAYTCNVKPDTAVSRSAPLDGVAEDRDFWFALNYTGNVLPGETGDMAWAGGQLPPDATGVTYTFPDGHTEEAVVRDGFWAMQYFAERTIPSGPKDHVEVAVDGADSLTFELPFTINTMCNQISHGC